MLKNNQYLNNKISSMLQELPIDFYFVDSDNRLFLCLGNDQIIMSKNTRDKLLKDGIITGDSKTVSNTMIVDNLNDGFMYVGKIHDNLEVDKTGDVYINYPSSVYLAYFKWL